MKSPIFNNRPNPLKSVTKFLLIAGLATVMGSSLHAAVYTWTGSTDNNFYNSGNWSAGWVNNYSQYDTILSDNANVTQTGGQINGGVVVSGTDLAGNAPVLNIAGNIATNSGWVAVGQLYSGGGGAELNAGNGIINQTTGTISSYAATNNMGISVASFNHYGAALSSGTYNFGGTSLATEPAFVQQVSLSATNATGLMIGGGGNGVMNLTGYGKLQLGRTGYYSLCIGGDRLWGSPTNGTGVLNITGANLSISTDNFYMNGANTTLNVTLDATDIGGLASTIFCSGTARGINGGVYFNNSGGQSHFSLTLASGFSATVGDKFTIIDSASAFDGSGTKSFAGFAEGSTYSSNGYTFAVTYTGASSYSGGDAFVFTTTAVPEPQTWVMMFSGFAMLMGGRRMRRK